MGFLMYYLSQAPQWEAAIRQEIRVRNTRRPHKLSRVHSMVHAANAHAAQHNLPIPACRRCWVAVLS